MAPCGQPCTHAGASPSARRSRAHVALADDAERLVEDRHLVGAGERAVAAADAGVVEVADDPGDRVLLVGLGRAALQARRVDAVVAGAGHGDRLPRPALAGAGRAGAGVVQRARPAATTSPSSRPLRLWHAATHALQPVQASRSTSNAYCWPGPGGVAGRRSRHRPAGGGRAVRRRARRGAARTARPRSGPAGGAATRRSGVGSSVAGRGSAGERRSVMRHPPGRARRAGGRRPAVAGRRRGRGGVARGRLDQPAAGDGGDERWRTPITTNTPWTERNSSAVRKTMPPTLP